MIRLMVAMRGRYNADGSTSQRLEPSLKKYSNAITTVQKDTLILVIHNDKCKQTD